MVPQDLMAADTNETLSVIIFAGNSGLRGTLRDGVKVLGVTAPEIVDNEAGCIKALQADSKAWLLMDMSGGAASVAKVLVAAQGENAFATRPIYLVSADVNPKVLSMALEFNVCKVHLGEVKATDVKIDLQAVGEIAAVMRQLNSVMKDLAKLRAEKNWVGADAILNTEISANPKNERLLLELAENSVMAGNYEVAQKITEQLLALSPRNLRAIHTLARVLMRRKMYHDAAKILTDAEAVSAVGPGRLIALGDCYLELGVFDKARSKFKAALSIDESNVDAKSGVIKTDLLTGNVDEALQLARSLGSNEDVAKILNAAAVVAALNNKNDEAQKMYEQGITFLQAHDALAARMWFNLGLSHYRANDYEKADICFEQSCNLDSSFKEAAHNRKAIAQRLQMKSTGQAPVKSSGSSAGTDTASNKLLDELVEEGNPFE